MWKTFAYIPSSLLLIIYALFINYYLYIYFYKCYSLNGLKQLRMFVYLTEEFTEEEGPCFSLLLPFLLYNSCIEIQVTYNTSHPLKPYISMAYHKYVQLLWQHFQAAGIHTTGHWEDSENALYCRGTGAVAQGNWFLQLSTDFSQQGFLL